MRILRTLDEQKAISPEASRETASKTDDGEAFHVLTMDRQECLSYTTSFTKFAPKSCDGVNAPARPAPLRTRSTAASDDRTVNV